MDHLLIASQRQDIVDVLVDNIQAIAKEQEPVTTTMRPTTTQSSSKLESFDWCLKRVHKRYLPWYRESIKKITFLVIKCWYHLPNIIKEYPGVAAV